MTLFEELQVQGNGNLSQTVGRKKTVRLATAFLTLKRPCSQPLQYKQKLYHFHFKQLHLKIGERGQT